MDAAKGLIGLDVTGCAEQYEIALLLPEGKVAQRASLNGKEVPLRTEAIESSHYCLLDASGVAVHHIELEVG
jgi:hypothetical protein